MPANPFAKITSAATHHQLFVAAIAAVSLVCLTWAIEKILDDHLLGGKKTIATYLTVIVVALTLLWIIKHYILHVI